MFARDFREYSVNEVVVSVFAVLTIVAPPLSAQQQFHLSDLKRIGAPHEDVPALKLGPNGEIVVAWNDKFDRETRVSRSADFGSTFEPSILLSRDDGIDSGGARVLVDRGGRAYVTWQDNHSGRQDLQFTSSPDAGLTWRRPDFTLNEDESRSADDFAIASDEDGRVFVAYLEFTDDPMVAYDTWFRRSLDGGRSFEPATLLETEGAFSNPVKIAADGVGSVYVFLGRAVTVPNGLYVQASLDHGATWLSPVLIDPGQELKDVGGMGCAPGGLVFAVWLDGRNGLYDVYFTRSLDHGQSFEPRIRLDTSTMPGESFSRDVSMASDDAGNIYVVWREGTDPRINISHDGGATWSGDFSLAIPGIRTGFVEPRIVANESGHVAVAWPSVEPGSSGLRLSVSRDFGETWGPSPIRIDEPDDFVFRHDLAMDAAGRMAAAWAEEYIVDDMTFSDLFARGIAPTLAISAVPVGDGDGLLVIPPEGDRMSIRITLRNHHPTDSLTGLSAWLEARLPDGRTVGPILGPKSVNIPSGVERRATFRSRFPGRLSPGLYALLVRSGGPIEDSARVLILKQ